MRWCLHLYYRPLRGSAAPRNMLRHIDYVSDRLGRFEGPEFVCGDGEAVQRALRRDGQRADFGIGSGVENEGAARASEQAPVVAD